MYDRCLDTVRCNIEQAIKAEGNSVHWWMLFDADIRFFVQRKHLHVILPLPKIYGDNRKKDEQERKRVEQIWSQFYEQLKEKLEEIHSGTLTVEEAFKDGIPLYEQYGLTYEGAVKIVK